MLRFVVVLAIIGALFAAHGVRAILEGEPAREPFQAFVISGIMLLLSWFAARRWYRTRR